MKHMKSFSYAGEAECGGIPPAVLHELMGRAQSDVVQGRIAPLPTAP